MLRELVALANELDSKGLYEEAVMLDEVIQKMAAEVPLWGLSEPEQDDNERESDRPISQTERAQLGITDAFQEFVQDHLSEAGLGNTNENRKSIITALLRELDTHDVMGETERENIAGQYVIFDTDEPLALPAESIPYLPE